MYGEPSPAGNGADRFPGRENGHDGRTGTDCDGGETAPGRPARSRGDAREERANATVVAVPGWR